MSLYSRGILMILGSAFCLSTSGIGLRVIESANGWQILFYRSLSMMGLVLVVLLLRPEPIARRIKNLTLDDFLLALVLGTGFCAYVFALLQTTVANALFIFSAAPFFAAVLGWLVLREAVPVRTWLAIGAAMVGLAVMVGAGVMGGRVLGNLIALWLPMSYAISVVLVRRSKQPDMLLALLLATLVATVISFFCNGVDFSAAEISFSLGAGLKALTIPAVPARDVWVAVAMGIFQVGAGFILMMLGARHVPAAQVGLLALVEPVLGPTWAATAATSIRSNGPVRSGPIVNANSDSDGFVTAAGTVSSEPDSETTGSSSSSSRSSISSTTSGVLLAEESSLSPTDRSITAPPAKAKAINSKMATVADGRRRRLLSPGSSCTSDDGAIGGGNSAMHSGLASIMARC